MGKLKKLLKNISIFGISQFSSKILVFILLPLYTKYLSTTEFGNADLVFSLVALLIPIFTMEISHAVMRFTIERTEDAKQYFRIGYTFILSGFALLLLGIPVFKLLHLFDGYLYLFYLYYIFNAFYILLSNYSRALDKIKTVGVCGVVNTVIIVSCNLLFLVVFRWGIKGYLLSYILGFAASSLIYVAVLWKRIPFRPGKLNFGECKEMLRYSVPLMPNNVAWWGVASANKFVIRSFLNEGILGLYSAALRVPSVISTVQSIISEGLVLTVLDQYDNKQPDNHYYSFLYELYSAFSIFVVLVIIVFSKFIASILFSAEFFAAWSYVPLLCISPIWGALSGYLGTFYSASKKTKGMFISTVLGAAVSVVFSIVGIRWFGVYAIVCGNILAYFLIWLYRWINVKKIVDLKVSMVKDVACWILLIALAIAVVRVSDSLVLLAIELVTVVLIFALNFKFLKHLLDAAFAKIKARKKQQ